MGQGDSCTVMGLELPQTGEINCPTLVPKSEARCEASGMLFASAPFECLGIQYRLTAFAFFKRLSSLYPPTSSLKTHRRVVEWQQPPKTS